MIVAAIVCVSLGSLVLAGCDFLSTKAENPAEAAVAREAINKAIEHMNSMNDVMDEVNQQLQLCNEAYDIDDPRRSTGYAEAAEELLPQCAVELAAAKKLLVSVDTTDAEANAKRSAGLFLDWVDSEIAESSKLTEHVAAVQEVAAAGDALTQAQVDEEYRLHVELLGLRREADEKRKTAIDFRDVQLDGESSTTIAAEAAFLTGYDDHLAVILALRDAMISIQRLRTHTYNETGPNRSLKPGDLVVKELESLVAALDELPVPPADPLRSLDSEWRLRVAQSLKTEQALAQKDTQKHRDDVKFFADKEGEALDALTGYVNK